jgi:2-oxoglutarate/2-oxoacid ferredoxin oxidoreductase subunit beta
MSEQLKNPLRKYARPGKLPHFFCPGCGCGQVWQYFIRAIDDLNMSLDNMVCIGGVGCTARIPVYLNTDVLHGVHGRTLAWATGIKMMKPDMKVVIFAGDGDLASIGGNHFIHAARRNLDVTVIVCNNLNFAMTGGQVAPTTPLHAVTMTTPYGSNEPQFDLCKLAVTAGATYVARWTPNRSMPAIRSIKTALQHKGFSMVEIITQCPTHFGRYALGTGKPDEMLKWIDKSSVSKADAETMAPEELDGKFVLGEFINVQRPVFEGTTVFNTGVRE